MLLLGLACLLPAKAIDLAIPYLFKLGIDGATREGIGPGHRHLTWREELGLAALAILIGAVSAALSYAMRRLLVRASRDFERDLRLTLHAKLLKLPQHWFGTTTVGDLVSRMTQDIEAVRMALGPGMMYVGNAIVAVSGAFALMFFMDRRLMLWMGVPFLVLGLVALLMARRLGRASDAVQQGIGKISACAAESFSAIRILKVFAGEERQHSRMRGLSLDYFDAQMKLAAARGGMMALLYAVKDVSHFVILLIGGMSIVARRSTIGDFVVYRSWMLQCFWPLVTFGWIVSMVQRAAAGMRRIADVLETVPAIDSPATPKAPAIPARGKALPIEWRDVTVRLGGRTVLDRVSLEVPAGGSLGITGPTGSGKSLLVQLVARLVDPDEGAVLVGGVDTREWELHSLRRAVGFVPQEPFLFSDLLRENLRFARPDASDAQGMEAARAAGLELDLAALAAGLDTRVGERGVTLSGGQRQRATLARALLADPPVVILDDALSAVDAETEARILARLRAELEGRTAVVVSHRVAALAGLDRIVVIEDGRRVEIGSHAELIRLGGHYARLEHDQRLLAEIEAL